MTLKQYSPNADVIEKVDETLFYGFIIKRNLRPNTVTITGSATPIPSTNLLSRVGLIIQNISTDNIYIGDITVTVANGFKVKPNGVFTMLVEDDIQIYGISDGTSSEIRILEGS